MIRKTLCPKINNNIIWRKEGEDKKIISLASFNGGPIWFLNPVAGKILELCNGKNSVKDIIYDISSRFESSKQENIKNDVIDFLKLLQEKNIIHSGAL